MARSWRRGRSLRNYQIAILNIQTMIPKVAEMTPRTVVTTLETKAVSDVATLRPLEAATNTPKIVMRVQAIAPIIEPIINPRPKPALTPKAQIKPLIAPYAPP